MTGYDVSGIRIGTAGWSIPRLSAARFESSGTHLQRYAAKLSCVEINSSFYRPHRHETYAKWRDSTPPGFRFSVKVPRTITHELKLLETREPLVSFLTQSAGLSEKRGPILIQLPPSLAFDAALVVAFLDLVRSLYDGPVVWEPRHPTWFDAAVTALFEKYCISRVAADPPPVPVAADPAGASHPVYFRLHGSPRMYWSRYDEGYIAVVERQ